MVHGRAGRRAPMGVSRSYALLLGSYARIAATRAHEAKTKQHDAANTWKPPGQRPTAALWTNGLLTKIQNREHLPIALDVLALEVVEQASTTADELEQTSARVVVFHVGLEVLCKRADAFTQQSDLDLGGPGVVFVLPMLIDQLGLPYAVERHLVQYLRKVGGQYTGRTPPVNADRARPLRTPVA